MTYEWIDPFAEIDRLKAEIPRAREEGIRIMEERLGEQYAPVLKYNIQRDAGRLARELVWRAVPPPQRSKAEEALMYEALAQRLLRPLVHEMQISIVPRLVIDADGTTRLEADVKSPVLVAAEQALDRANRAAMDMLATVRR